ncbi:MAG: SDR family NAD(P)-dependent oxidoreductase, partial [Saprospiraceae bacterium]|nr:SDR family NAD(P)-dependent oxidoreductase [Gammaproteobacteria bacterium]NNE27594.1 SDR family NAD(P)-dependent oxidoreductase [Saprospiraceae bacterium]
MNLDLKDKLFVVTGATSGFGKAIASRLCEEGAQVIINARTEANLKQFASQYPDQIEIV